MFLEWTRSTDKFSASPCLPMTAPTMVLHSRCSSSSPFESHPFILVSPITCAFASAYSPLPCFHTNFASTRGFAGTRPGLVSSPVSFLTDSARAAASGVDDTRAQHHPTDQPVVSCSTRTPARSVEPCITCLRGNGTARTVGPTATAEGRSIKAPAFTRSMNAISSRGWQTPMLANTSHRYARECSCYQRR